MSLPRLLVFGYGTGFENLVNHSRGGDLDAFIAAGVATTVTDAIHERADRLGVPLVQFAPPFTAERYREIAENWRADYVALSGWLKLVRGLDPARTFNIHPGPLPEFGGRGMYGIRVHQAVHDAWRNGQWPYPWSVVSMHFVTDDYDRGPVFFEYPVGLFDGDNPEAIQLRVRDMEHVWQPIITNLVVHGEISWDGKNPASLNVPKSHVFLPQR